MAATTDRYRERPSTEADLKPEVLCGTSILCNTSTLLHLSLFERRWLLVETTARSESIQTLSESYTLALEPILNKGSRLFVSLYFVFYPLHQGASVLSQVL